MADLEFRLFRIPSEAGDWLAAFEGPELIFLGSYEAGKKLVEDELAAFFHLHYNFHVGKFTTAKWTGKDFWKSKHQIKLMGTEFQVKTWLALTKIPAGKTITYTDLAKKMKKPTAVRSVASAVARNPVCYYIPCHRVVGKGASKMKYHYGPNLKKELLTLEGALN